ncbi:transporter substrate-binding domain-containing protein [uncultured Senegalimassilia sp.]|uniref:substrate-binding periplasmic protein n=1 Tax=uncultured Senegalimassilia sp. TaxID=1714350 RepID=UPI002604075D|nr:transporter substrate-binding domain-containing protein [uncultured Senegalimassilia sp.]
MKHLKRFAACCAAAVCCAAMLLLATGCQQQQESYTPPEATPAVSKPVIGQEGVLRVGVNANNAPLAGQPSSSTKIVGIDVDMAAALADQLGLKLEVVDVSTDAAGALTSGKVDVVMGVNKSDSPSFWTSDTYLPTAVALFAQSSNSTVPANSASTKIAAQVSSNSAWAVTNEFDNSTITTTEDLKSAFFALESGKVQYVAADAVVGSYVSNNAGMDVHMVALMQQASGYCVGVLDGNTQLKQAVSNALSAMNSNGVSSIIQKKWLGTTMDLSGIKLTAGASDDGDDMSEVLNSANAAIGTLTGNTGSSTNKADSDSKTSSADSDSSSADSGSTSDSSASNGSASAASN